MTDAEHFLTSPNEISEDGALAFTSALWRYMTPTSPMPSVHDVVIGKFVASPNDHAAGILTGNWGLTTYILTDAAECAQGSETTAAIARADYYREFRS